MSVLHVIGADSIVREDWLLDVVARLQGTLGSAAFEGTESGALRAAASDLPLPVNRLEELLLGGLLLEIAVGGRGLTVNDLQERARRVAEAFTRAPGLSVAQRAASEICRTYQLPLKVAGLAERLGCEKTCLRRQFQNEYGTTLRDYHLRARIQAAVKLIGTGAVKISAVAVSVGYCSDKNFYRATRELTGCTPGELKAQTPLRLSHLAEALLPRRRGSLHINSVSHSTNHYFDGSSGVCALLLPESARGIRETALDRVHKSELIDRPRLNEHASRIVRSIGRKAATDPDHCR